MARPRVDFDWSLVESLAAHEASEEFIAERLLIKEGIEPDFKKIQAKIKLLQRRIKERYEMSFVQYRDKNIEPKRIKLRQLQWKSAEAGNVATLIWLGKQYLGQADKLETVNETTEVQTIEYKIGWADEDHATTHHQAPPPNASTEAH